MTVEPGAGGQLFLPDSASRIARVRQTIAAGDLDCLLQVDGGISKDTIAGAAEAGADTFVAGNSVFRAPDPTKALRELREALKTASSRPRHA